MIADKLNRETSGRGLRYVALAHTEGCGASGGDSEVLYLRTMAGYLAHPLVSRGLLLEHGCEKTHNDAMRNFLAEQKIDINHFGCASVQLDGGIESVTRKVTKWFQAGPEKYPQTTEAGLGALPLGLTSVGPLPDASAEAFALVARSVVSLGGTVVVAQNSSLLVTSTFARELLATSGVCPTLSYGQSFSKAGLHIMETPTDHYVETLTGLGATGVQIMIAHVTDHVRQGHPMIPVLQITSQITQQTSGITPGDVDLVLDPGKSSPASLADEILKLIVRVAGREYTPKLFAWGNTDFQMTRGLLGVSM
jgi:altronate dehydratase